MNDMTVAQPINGSRGATVAGPRNIPLEAQVPDIFAAPLTDHGSIPNLHFPFAYAQNPLGGRRRLAAISAQRGQSSGGCRLVSPRRYCDDGGCDG